MFKNVTDRHIIDIESFALENIDFLSRVVWCIKKKKIV